MQKPSENQIYKKFIGAWKLVQCVQTDENGNASYPWGQEALGYIIYTAEGVMSVQIMRKNRKSPSEQNVSSLQEIEKEYNAYFGRFEINETNQTVIHLIEGHLNPKFIGKQKIRTYNFYDNKLSLTSQGEIISINFIWQKVITLV